MPRVETFSQGKSPERNEDCYGHNETTFVVADGATDKTGKRYGGKTGGEIASRLVVDECLRSSASGPELVARINTKLAELYQRINPEAITKGFYRFECAFVCAKVSGKKLIVTQVADVAFRINGKRVFTNDKLIDELSSGLRAHYIRKTGDVAGSREVINPLLKNQWQYANTSASPLSYGVISGVPTPEQFINVHRFTVSSLHTLEIWSDGYFDEPDEVSLSAWEAKHQEVEQEDPDKWQKYKAPKSKDDRTVMLVSFASSDDIKKQAGTRE